MAGRRTCRAQCTARWRCHPCSRWTQRRCTATCCSATLCSTCKLALTLPARHTARPLYRRASPTATGTRWCQQQRSKPPTGAKLASSPRIPAAPATSQEGHTKHLRALHHHTQATMQQMRRASPRMWRQTVHARQRLCPTPRRRRAALRSVQAAQLPRTWSGCPPPGHCASRGRVFMPAAATAPRQVPSLYHHQPPAGAAPCIRERQAGGAKRRRPLKQESVAAAHPSLLTHGPFQRPRPWCCSSSHPRQTSNQQQRKQWQLQQITEQQQTTEQQQQTQQMK